MRVPRQRQRDAVWHPRENIGFVREQDHRRIVGDLRERACQIVDADEAAAAERKRDLVTKARQPKTMGAVLQADGCVLVNR